MKIANRIKNLWSEFGKIEDIQGKLEIKMIKLKKRYEELSKNIDKICHERTVNMQCHKCPYRNYCGQYDEDEYYEMIEKEGGK
jgi:predicted nuclease with TOPRIM domain